MVSAAILLAGCTQFTTQVFRTQQTAENLAYTAYVGYTNALGQGVIHIDPTNAATIKEARLKFAASDKLVDNLRMAYDTNSFIKPQLVAAVSALGDQSSNVVWTIHFLTSKQ